MTREREPGEHEIERRVLRMRGAQRDLDEELAFHFAETVEELMSRGVSREDAEVEAGRRFGDEARYRRQLAAIDRDVRRSRRWRDRFDTAGEVTRSALRGVRRAPGLSAGVVLAFTLGIGANATMYGTVDRLLLRPPDHIRNPDAVVLLHVDRFVPWRGSRWTQASFTYPDLIDLQAVSAFSGVAGHGGGGTLTIGSGPDARQWISTLATGNYWEVLGVRPALGRFFTPAEDVRGGEPVAVISHGIWQREYAGARDVLGHTIDFGHGPYTIIGVAPRGFTGAEITALDLWLPLEVAHKLQDGCIDSRGCWWVRGVARMRDGVALERAEAEASGVFTNSRRAFIDRGEEAEDQRIVAASLIAARGPNPAPEAAVAQWLAAVSALVLLIACANVANLLLARTIRQRRETGIRLALGISRARLIAHMLAEGLVLAALGAVAALAVTQWGGSFVQRLLLPDVAWGSAVTRQVLVFVAIVTVLAGVVSTLIPALQATRTTVAGALRESSGGITRSASRLRTGLSLTQASLCVVLLVGAGLFVRSLERAQSLELGFEPEQVLYAQPVLVPEAMPADEQRLFFGRVAEELTRLPSVRSSATAHVLPFRSSMANFLKAEGVDSIRTPPSGGPYVWPVSSAFLPTLGIDVIRGRGLEPGDHKDAPQVAVVNESMAKMLWPTEDAIGKCLYLDRGENVPCTRIIGIVEDARRQMISEGVQAMYYLSIEQDIMGSAPRFLVLRVEGDLASAAAAVRNAIIAADPRVRFADVRPMREFIDPQLRSWKLGATMFSVFGLLALLVAAIGLYSVLSFDVAQRTREIGLRSALGASRSSILRMFIRRAVALSAVGTAIGVIAALALAPGVEDLLFETSPRDPLIVIGVVVTLLAVALLAGGFPAWRAARLDPNVALRAD